MNLPSPDSITPDEEAASHNLSPRINSFRETGVPVGEYRLSGPQHLRDTLSPHKIPMVCQGVLPIGESLGDLINEARTAV